MTAHQSLLSAMRSNNDIIDVPSTIIVITSSTFVLLVEGVVWRVNVSPQLRPPVEPKLVGGSSWKLVGLISSGV